MPAIRPEDLPSTGTVNNTAALIVDTGSNVVKATPQQVVDAARPLASQAEAQSGSDNSKMMTPLRVKQAIDQIQAITAVDSLMALKAADTSTPRNWDGATFTFTPGNFTGQADDQNIIKADSTALSVGAWVRQGAQSIAIRQAGAGAVTEDVEKAVRRFKWAEQYGLVGVTMAEFDAMSAGAKATLAASNAAAILAAVVALRTNPVLLSTNGLGGGSFTAYSSGELLIGEGIFPIAPDILQFSADLGLTIRGRGTRGGNNSIRGRTVLLEYGASSGFFIQMYANGARALGLENLDICYAESNFTGDLIDLYSTPYVTLNRVYIGTNGISAPTRLVTARSCIRSTYDEFLRLDNVVMNGAVDGWWSDDSRSPSPGFSEFGGAASFFSNVVVYDVSGSGFRHDGNRTRAGHTMAGCFYNPIQVSGQRGIKFDNIDGLALIGCGFAGSTTHFASIEWARCVNVTGSITACYFNDLTKAGTFGGPLTMNGNKVFCTDGFTIVGGPFRGFNNEFSKGEAGYKFGPASQCSAVVGPDIFNNTVSYSYDIPTDSALLAVTVQYDSASDGSANKFRNVSNRVSIKAATPRIITVSDPTYTISRLDTGNIITATGSASQTFTLPTATPGCEYKIRKFSDQQLVVSRPSGTTLRTGTGATKDSLTAAAGDSGGTLVFAGQTGPVYILEAKTGVWTEA